MTHCFGAFFWKCSSIESSAVGIEVAYKCTANRTCKSGIQRQYSSSRYWLEREREKRKKKLMKNLKRKIQSKTKTKRPHRQALSQVQNNKNPDTEDRQNIKLQSKGLDISNILWKGFFLSNV